MRTNSIAYWTYYNQKSVCLYVCDKWVFGDIIVLLWGEIFAYLNWSASCDITERHWSFPIYHSLGLTPVGGPGNLSIGGLVPYIVGRISQRVESMESHDEHGRSK